MRKFALIIAILVFTPISLSLIYPLKDYRYECTGEISGENSATLFILYTEYRNWMIWTQSDGNMLIEIHPIKFVRAFHNIQTDNFSKKIYTFEGDSAGSFSNISSYLELETGIGKFSGLCKPKLYE